MKLNEFKKSNQINEIDASSILGNYGAAALKNAAKSLSGDNIGTVNQMAKDSFIKNFIKQAGETLRTGIKSGLIDSPTATTPAATPATTPSAGPTTPETPEQKRIRLQKAAAQVANKQAIPVSKTANPTTPETPEQKRIRLQKAAAQVANKQAMPASKLPANQAQVQAANIRQKKLAKATPAFEANTFDKLNAVFESIVRIDEAQSIGSELKTFVTQYMRGIDLSKYQASIQPAIDAVQSSYSTDQGRAALKNLGNMLYSISMTAGGGSGAKPEASSLSSGTSQILSQINAVADVEKADDLAAIVQNALSKLMQIDKAAYSNLISAIKSGGYSGKINTPKMTIGGQKQDPNDPATAKMMAMAKQQGKV